jgi:hypothetical protein
LIQFGSYCRQLGFEEDPDYGYLRSLFQRGLKKLKYSEALDSFDWIKKRKKLIEDCSPKKQQEAAETPAISKSPVKSPRKRLFLSLRSR